MSAPYIGSRINLISKSDVRYEGILCGIDTNESKVYLQHVRCYGTEDRKKDSPIAPASEVYDVIIFHSTDIKDLSVCELPPVYDPMGFNSFSHMGSGYPQYGYPMVHPQYGPQYGYYNPYHNYGMFPQNPPMMPHQEMYNSGYPPMAPNDAHDKSAQLNLTPPQKINVTTTKVPEKSEFSTSNTPTSTPSESTPSENENNSDPTPNESSKEVPSSSSPSPTPLPELKGDSPSNSASFAPSEDQNTQKLSSHSHSKSQNNHHHNNNHHHHHNKRSNNPRNSNFVYLPKGEAKNTSSPSDKHNENVNNNTPPAPSGNSHPVENTTDSSASDSSAPSSSNRSHNNHSNSSHNQDFRQKRGGNNLNNRGGYKHYNRRGYDSRSHHSNTNHSNHHTNTIHNSNNNTSANAHSSESTQNTHFGKTKEEKEDFDFLSANSKFEKLSISEDLDKSLLPKIAPSYNKDDFYDTISCEALDHDESKEKKSYYEQRKIDSETFGDLGRRNNSNNNRGRTRRYNNNNNSNNNRGNRNYRGNKNSGPSS